METSQSSPTRTYRIPEIAEILRIRPATAYDYARRGIIPTIRVGRTVRVTEAGLAELLARRAT
jgi:excisionase family DNA binding protein